MPATKMFSRKICSKKLETWNLRENFEYTEETTEGVVKEARVIGRKKSDRMPKETSVCRENSVLLQYPLIQFAIHTNNYDRSYWK